MDFYTIRSATIQTTAYTLLFVVPAIGAAAGLKFISPSEKSLERILEFNSPPNSKQAAKALVGALGGLIVAVPSLCCAIAYAESKGYTGRRRR